MTKRGPYFTLDAARDFVAAFPDGAPPLAQMVSMIVAQYDPHPSSVRRFEKRAMGLLSQATEEQLQKSGEHNAPVISGTLRAPEDNRGQAEGDVFVFTSAQANTYLNEGFWKSLMSLVQHRDASLHISRFTYNKQSFGKNSVKPDTHEESDDEDIWFDPRIVPFVSDSALQITDDLVWCGDLNIIPTRVDPLNGFENHGRGASVIIPHTKMAMRSVPTMKYEPTRFAYSTGTVTARNYIEKAAGQKASLHHVYGALLVEVDRDTGQWWARQINADNNGVIYDLWNKYDGDKVTTDNRAKVIVHGDIHGDKFNFKLLPAVKDLIGNLKPAHQVFHDTIDFMARNHHNVKDPHFLHEMRFKSRDNVRGEFWRVGDLLAANFEQDGCEHWIITSNHDQAIETWLRNTAAFYDPCNMEFWLKLNLYGALKRKSQQKPKYFASTIYTALDRADANPMAWNVVDEDDDLKIGSIQYGLHGHLGPNGARGNPKNLRSIGKACTGHTHSAGITEGVYTAGVYGNLDMGYNKGPSSWSHSAVVVYENDKRTIVTFAGTDKEGYRAWR